MSTSRVISLVVAVAACAAGCGGGEEPARDEPLEPPSTGGRMAGELLVMPASAEAGEKVGIAVRNTGEVALLYGLGNRVQRRVEGGWEEATGDVYGRPAVFPSVGLIVEPGERGGPDYGQLSDRIALPRDLEPGTYRVRKHVRARQGPGTTTLQATFTVRDRPR